MRGFSTEQLYLKLNRSVVMDSKGEYPKKDDPENEDSKHDDWRDKIESIHFQATSWPETLKQGEAILELAKQHPEQSQILSACATIIMAATLEQGTWAKLANAAARAEHEGNDPKPYADLITTAPKAPRVSLRDRIRRIPGLLTKGRLQFNGGSTHARFLEQLISFRIWLLHTPDDVIVMEKTDPRIAWEGENPVIDPSVFPDSPWCSVTLGDARNFRDAVSAYMREVIKPDPDDMKPGEIVKEISQ